MGWRGGGGVRADLEAVYGGVCAGGFGPGGDEAGFETAV